MTSGSKSGKFSFPGTAVWWQFVSGWQLEVADSYLVGHGIIFHPERVTGKKEKFKEERWRVNTSVLSVQAGIRGVVQHFTRINSQSYLRWTQWLGYQTSRNLSTGMSAEV